MSNLPKRWAQIPSIVRLVRLLKEQGFTKQDVLQLVAQASNKDEWQRFIDAAEFLP